MVRRPPPSEIPDTPGVYLFRDEHGEILYVGKARSLRKRIANYFAPDLPLKTAAMTAAADSLEWIVTPSDVAAIMLEYSMVQEHQPRFNIRLRDDKSFPYLAITADEQWPRAMVMRGKRRKGVVYFGPYAHAYSIRQTLDLLLRTFPIRTCSDAKYRRHEAAGRPCLLAHIEKCSAPCVGAVDAATYAGHVEGLAGFLAGDISAVTERLDTDMERASQMQDYEQAARLRDRLVAVRKAMERQELVTDRPENFDIVGLALDELEAVLVVLNVRRGRVTGRKTTVIDRVEEVSTAGLVGILLGRLYGSERPPPTVLVQELPEDDDLWQAWLTDRRGSTVSLRVPQRGAKRRIMQTAIDNAHEEFRRHRLRRLSDHNARARALNDLQEVLALDKPPLRIECYDVSTIQGRDTVASMVVFEDGLPRKSDYRRFKIRTVAGQDDFAAMEETLRRRFTAYLVDRELPVEERGKFAYPPSLVVVDGGAGQLGRAVAVLAELEIDIPAVGLAKRLEEVYVPGGGEPITIAKGRESLYLLQRVRDEAHRFAVTYHRKLRTKRMIDSILDDVDGVGPARKSALVKEFGSLKGIRAASKEELAGVVPDRVAAALWETLHE
ncbi:MAG: excinuclease ABC subunit UvrC [Acidimicrobiia bacterium]|nr:MAG: excinuclease ABC subunit UvrC [Acidimicrobiia bacterium]